MGASAFLKRSVRTSMAKTSSKLTELLGRFIKAVMVALLLPLAVGLLTGILEQLEVVSLSGGTFREWIGYGFMTYVWVHLLLYRPAPLFQASHRLFSSIAVWLFGGQVASVEQAGSGKGKGAKGAKGEAAVQGSTLIAFSPYVIPLSTVLICAAGWLLMRWWDRVLIDGPLSFLIGLTAAFHWLMTADDLQQQRARWHLETYLLAIGLIFVLTLLIGMACLPWAVPDFSLARALTDGLARTHAIYTMTIQRLFL